MSTATQTPARTLNGINASKIEQLAQGCNADPRNAAVGFAVSTEWTGGAGSTSRVAGFEIAGRNVARSFTIDSDEPTELCGANAAPNPQELLMASLNACMTVGYVAGATLAGIKLTRLSIETKGRLDLRGFLGLDADVKPGYGDGLHYVVRIAGDGTPKQFAKILETVMATSPNRWNVVNPIRLTSELVVE